MVGISHRERSNVIKAIKRTTFLSMGLALLLQLISTNGYAYLVGDFGSTASGNWNVASTWSTWNGVAWVAAGATPASGNNVHILSGRTVNVPSTGPYSCRDLVVEGPPATTRLWTTNFATNIYIYVYGTQIVCNGTIGDGNTFDGISFGIEGANCTITGTGVFDTSRMRKNTATNATTNLTISMNVGLHFNTASSTMIYNAAASTTAFNVTVAAGSTVSLIAAGGTGNVCMNGTGGSGGGGGAYTIFGSLIIQNSLILINLGASPAISCSFTIKNGGYVRAASLNCGASGTSGHSLVIEDGGTLELNGVGAAPMPFVTAAPSGTNNTYTLGLTSLVIYSGTGNQTIYNIGGLGYGHLTVSGLLGNKTLGGNANVRSNLTILNGGSSPKLDAGANYNLSVGGNWSNYGQVGFTEQLGRVIFTNHYAAATLTTPGGEVFYNLQMSKNAGQLLTMQNDATVTNTLVFQAGSGGCLDLNANMLTISNPLAAAVVGGNANGFVKSERMDNLSRMRWSIGSTTGAHVFPFGAAQGAANWIPFTYNLTAGNAGDVTVATYGTPPNNLSWPVSPITVLNLNSTTGLLPDNRDATVDRFWEIDHAGSPTTSYTFVYRTSELPVAPYNVPGAIHAQRYDDPLDKWQVPIAGQTSGLLASTYYASVNGVTRASAPWTLSSLASPLPIELIDLHAEGGCGEITVKWSTATEKDNDHFMLRRSADGEVFEDLVRVEGAGTSQQQLDYSFVDADPLPGMNYYRLDQYDVDGTETQSVVIAGRTLTCDDLTATVYPNPATDQLSVVGLPTGHGLGVNVDLIDGQGRVLRNWLVTGDRNRLDIDQLGVAPGGYLLRIVTNDRSQTVRVIVR